MVRCGVALMLSELVEGILLMERRHDTIADNFRNDTGGGDATRLGVTINNRGLRNSKRRNRPAINQQVLWLAAETCYGPMHGQVGSLENVDPIDLFD